MIFVTGDLHLPIDIGKLNAHNFNTKEMTKNDYVIICGDFGGIWNYKGEDKEEKFWLDWLEEKPFTTLWVDGNHECFPRLFKDYPVENWNGGKVRKIRPSVIYLSRGQVFNIDGKKFFTMGGASSHDKEYRKEGISWWKEELPSEEDYKEALENLKQHNYKVDYVITHCMPDNVQNKIAYWYEHDKLTNFLFTIDKELEFIHWYSGHYHITQMIDEKHTVLYNTIDRIY